MWTSSSTRVGGGVRGKGDGIARGSIIQAGANIKELHLFIEVYPQAGGTTTEMVVGKDSNGTTNEYPTNKFKRIIVTGKRTNIGRKIIGVSIRTAKIRTAEIRTAEIGTAGIRIRTAGIRTRTAVTMTANTIDRERRCKLTLNRENLKEARKKNGIERRLLTR